MLSQRIWSVLLLGAIAATPALADKVIMKSGKVYEGRIMGETSHSVLISNAPVDPQPHFLQYRDILTIVRDKPELQPVRDSQRTLMGEVSLTGRAFFPDAVSQKPAPGLHLGGGLRPHPLVEADALFDWVPGISGDAVISDGTTTREYEHFYSYSGGFAVRLYPFYRFKSWAWEPYLVGGYEWSRLVMKGSGDHFSGRVWHTGLGTLHVWHGHLFWDFRLWCERATYDEVEFLTRQGELRDAVHVPTFGFSAGLSYRY